MDDGEIKTKRWFTLESHEGKTADVCLRLAGAGFEVWRPFVIHRLNPRAGRRVANSNGRRHIERRYPRFGRYFFLRCVLTDSLYHEVAHLPNLRGFLCMPGTRTPHPIGDHEIDWLRLNIPEKPKAGWDQEFHKGMRVRITAGPLEGMVGAIQTLDKRGVLKLNVENKFGPAIPVVVEVGHVAPVVAQARPPAGTNDNRSRVNLTAGAKP